MSRLENLPPDQRATLSLLLGQRKSYAEVATLLGIPERAVHDRAHAALAILDPLKARELTAERRASVGDYLLGQQTSVSERLATRTYLDSSAPAREWANAIATEIAPLSSAPLPDVPQGSDGPAIREGNGEAGPGRPLAASESPGVEPARPAQPISRLGGALLLGGILVAVIVAVILATSGGGGSHATTTTAGSTANASSSGSAKPGGSTASKGSTGGGPTEEARLTLTPPDPSSKAIGVVAILAEGSKQAFYLAAEHLPPTNGFFYAIWLYKSPTSFLALSKSPPVGSSGTLQGGALLPANAGQYDKMLLTRETSERPSHPGPIVLSGPFSLGRSTQ
jgi:sigma-70-like protein